MSKLTRIVQRRLGASAATGDVPPLSVVGTSNEYFDRAINAKMLSTNGGPYLPMAVGASAAILQVTDFNLAVNISTTALSPVYSTLLTAAMTTTEPASFLSLAFYGTVLFFGGAGNRACAPRVRIDGVLMPISRAVTVNTVMNQIATFSLLRRVPVVAGLHTVVVEWTRFGGGAFEIMTCQPALRPDLEGAYLQLQEQM